MYIHICVCACVCVKGSWRANARMWPRLWNARKVWVWERKTYVYICVCEYTYLCISKYRCIYTYRYIDICIYTYIFIYWYIYICLYVCMYIYTYMYKRVRVRSDFDERARICGCCGGAPQRWDIYSNLFIIN